MFPVTVSVRRVRWLVILYGLLVFIWLGPEDGAVWPVAALGAAGAVLAALLWLPGRLGGLTLSGSHIPVFLALAGALTGLGASLLTAALMLFKNARHSHLFPDYPPAMMGAILERAPIWAAAGGLFGLGLGLIWLAYLTEQTDNK